MSQLSIFSGRHCGRERRCAPHRSSKRDCNASNARLVEDLHYKKDRVRLFQAPDWMTCFTTTGNVL